MKRTVCVDFDGVLNEYRGYNERDLYSPKPFVENFLEKLNQDYEVIIYTSRVNSRVETWLERNNLMKYISKVTSKKVPAIAYIDDRAIQFKGNYNETLMELESFEPYWSSFTEKDEKQPSQNNTFEELTNTLFETSSEFPKEVLAQIKYMREELDELERIVILDSYSRGKLTFEEE